MGCRITHCLQEGDLWKPGQADVSQTKACKTAMMQTSVIDGYIVVETGVRAQAGGVAETASM